MKYSNALAIAPLSGQIFKVQMQDSKLFKVDIFEWYFGFRLQAKITEQLLHEKMSLFNHFQRTVKETHASKLCDSMKQLPENITQSKIEYIQGNLQQADTKKKRRFFFAKKKINKISENMQLSVVLQQPFGNLNADFLI